MNDSKIPKILIVGETFRSDSGGGITLSNLFKGYPKECLANAIDSSEIMKIASDEICDKFYGLGEKEKKAIKPFSIIQKKYRSGIYYPTDKKLKVQSYRNKSIIRERITKLIFKILHFTGLFHVLYSYKVSDELKTWIDEFSPDIIYTQLSTRELILFIDKLVEYTGASLAIHIMDDWPTTISQKSILKKYWEKKIDSEFRNLLNKANIFLSISEGMSEEYFQRYNKKFIPFHNPIEIEKWLPFSKNDVQIKNKNVKILYAGRIGLGINKSLLDLANAINELRNEGLNVEFRIQTTTINAAIKKKLNKFRCVKFNSKVDYLELPKIFSGADLLVMPIDFSNKSINFLKFSMPTKASEYMISGTPILMYADKQVSLVKHASKYGWARVVNDQSIYLLKNEISNLLNNYELRLQLSNTAKKHAMKYFSANEVRNNFHNQFIKTNPK